MNWFTKQTYLHAVITLTHTHNSKHGETNVILLQNATTITQNQSNHSKSTKTSIAHNVITLNSHFVFSSKPVFLTFGAWTETTHANTPTPYVIFSLTLANAASRWAGVKQMELTGLFTAGSVCAVAVLWSVAADSKIYHVFVLVDCQQRRLSPSGAVCRLLPNQ